MFPTAFKNRMTSLLGKDAPLFWQAMNEEPCRALRLDPEKISYDELKENLAGGLGEPCPYGENAYFFQYDGIGNLPLHHGGAVYVQEPAAMAPVAALPEMQVERILDLCAAPGGKSLQAAKKCLAPGGVIVCNEPYPIRRKALMQNGERMGEKRLLVTGFDAAELPEAFSNAFDLVILDAPCSGEGMMRKDGEARERWSEDTVKSCAALQKKILKSAANALKSGGILLYSTCTWSLEENEEQILTFLCENEDFSLVAPKKEVALCGKEGFCLDGNDALKKTLRFYPHIAKGEGQFLAILKKSGEDPPSPKRKEKKKDKKEPHRPIAQAFLLETLGKLPEEEILFRNEDVYLVPKHPFPQELFYSPGVLLGTVQKGRIVPHHRFFMAYATSFPKKAVLPWGDDRIEAYLRGEEIPLEGKGYTPLFCEKIPLGGVKIGGGRGKNLYPKGLRKN